MAHIRDRPSLRESVEITTLSGKSYRWADDESIADNVPSGERFSDTMPGGFAEHDAVLSRKASVDYSDLERLSTITRYDASGGIIWQGRLERAPKVSGDQIAISPSAVGYQAHLADDKSASMIYIDQDLSRWESPPAQRRLALSGSLALHDMRIEQDADGSPALILAINDSWSGIRPICEAWYDSGPGLKIGSVYYSLQNSAQLLLTVATWDLTASATDDSGAAGSSYDAVVSDRINGSGAFVGNNQSTTLTTARRRLLWQLLFNSVGAAGVSGGRYEIHVRNLAVFGDHGLTTRGTAPDQGFYDADIIGHALARWCPLIAVTDESLIADPFVIPHAAFHEPTTVAEIVRQTTRFGLRDWAVWEGPTFWLHDRGARGRKWRARVGESRLEETGLQIDRLWESVIVQYQDVDGSKRTVGPVGSGADTETDDLKDDDPENPANRAGLVRRDMLTMGTSTAAGATEIGRRFLEESSLLDSSGRARLVGHVEDDRGVWHPYSHVRAGDTISFVDASDTSYRRIVRTDKSRDDRSCSVDLDAPPEGLQALLERLGVVLVPLGF